MGADVIAAKLRAACYREVQDAQVAVFGAPPVDGLGSAGGFKVMVRDVGTLGLDPLQEAADTLAASGNEQPELVGLFSAFRAQSPQMYVDVDREKCKALGVALNEVFLTLQLYLGGYYTNDFNQFGRTWQVNLQGDPKFRLSPEQVRQLKVRNQAGEMVPRAAWPASATGGPALVILTTATPPRQSAAAPSPASAGHRHSNGGRRRPARIAAGNGPSVDRADVFADPGGQHGYRRVCRGRGPGVPGAGGAV
jgi:multidrug efflux pump